ncbi:MAG: YHS domain-containing protein, partial [Proteobacteria bacterium]|nr:YHS domain-containing protein [Pseudomonadota bacterium]
MSVSTESALQVVHAAKTYYFCSTRCKSAFEVDPPRYVAARAAATAAVSPLPHSHAHAHSHDGAGAPPVSPTPKSGKDMAKDPVCGMTVKPDSPHVATHAGHTYRFCSAKCQGKFEAEPERYLKPGPAPAPLSPTESAAAVTEYTCPMHPEIRQIGPGTCPKCGMALEPVMPGGEEGENPELADFRHRFWWT